MRCVVIDVSDDVCNVCFVSKWVASRLFNVPFGQCMEKRRVGRVSCKYVYEMFVGNEKRWKDLKWLTC